MYIILKQTNEEESIINVMYGDDDSFVRKWVTMYLNEEIESLNQSPCPKNCKDIEYEIHSDNNKFSLIKKYIKCKVGFIYNSSERVQEILYTIRFLSYDNTNSILDAQSSPLWKDINTEINNRVLKQLDKQSLYQVMMKIQNALGTKKTWNREEYTNVVCEVIKNFKKELYSSIAKKMKRFGKKKASVPSSFVYNTCKLEAYIKNKHE